MNVVKANNESIQTTMSKAYFQKESLRNKIVNRDTGQFVQWEAIGNDSGVKEVDTEADASTFKHLEGLADKRRMGVIRISGESFDSLKKNPLPSRQSPSPSAIGQQIRAFNQEAVLPKINSAGVKPAVVPVVDTTPPPVTTGTPTGPGTRPRAFTPRSKKASAVVVPAAPTEQPKA